MLTAALRAPDLAADHCWPMPLLETPGHSQASLGQSLVGSLLLSPGSWCTQDFVCALQESVSPVLWKFCDQIPLAFKVKFSGGSQSLRQISRLGNLLWVLELFNSAIISWYNCSSVCGLSAWWLYGGVNGDLLQEEISLDFLLQGNKSWISTGRTDVEAKTPILWPPDVMNWLIWKDPDAVKDWRWEEKGATEDEMVGWHGWLSGYIWASSRSW